MWTFDVQTQGWAVGRCVIVTVVWTRAITWLKIFRSVRYLITMVLRVFHDMVAYLAVLTSAVFGLAFIWRLSFYFPPEGDNVRSRENLELVPTFFSSLQVVTMIVLGNMPNSEADGREFSTVKFLVAVAFGIILALALTNLLIAIISQTYSDIETTKKLHDLKEVIGLVIDFNGSASFLSRCELCKKRKYVMSIHKKMVADTEVERFKKVTFLTEEKFTSAIDTLNEKFAKIEEHNVEKCAKIENQIIEKCSKIENQIIEKFSKIEDQNKQNREQVNSYHTG